MVGEERWECREIAGLKDADGRTLGKSGGRAKLREDSCLNSGRVHT